MSGSGSFMLVKPFSSASFRIIRTRGTLTLAISGFRLLDREHRRCPDDENRPLRTSSCPPHIVRTFADDLRLIDERFCTTWLYVQKRVMLAHSLTDCRAYQLAGIHVLVWGEICSRIASVT